MFDRKECQGTSLALRERKARHENCTSALTRLTKLHTPSIAENFPFVTSHHQIVSLSLYLVVSSAPHSINLKLLFRAFQSVLVLRGTE